MVKPINVSSITRFANFAMICNDCNCYFFIVHHAGFYGMSSATAMDKHHGGVAEYRASEGKTVEVAYRGDVRNTMNDILGGLRSACTYTGSSKL